MLSIKLSESKTTKEAFTYYVITEGGGRGSLKGLCMIVVGGLGVDLMTTYTNTFFYKVK